MSDPDGPHAVAAEDLTGSLAQARDPSSSFADRAYLTYLVPADTDLDLDRAFKDADGSRSILESVERRDALFFDETVNVLLVLKCPWLDERELQAQFRRLVISLQAQVVNGNAPGRESPPAAETIFTGRVPDVADPFVVVGEEEGGSGEDGVSQHVYAVWKMPVFLARPRMRPQRPSVVFSASASLRPDVAAELTARAGAGYLQSRLPASVNLLESFADDPALGDVKPRLSALRVSRVAPVTGQQDLMAHLRALPQLELSIHPVAHTRIRFSRPNTSPPSASIVALLEIDFTPHVECEVLLDQVKLLTPDGTVESLNDEAGMELPLSCVSHDHITFLYHIKPHQHLDTGSKSLTGNLDIAISASVLVTPGVCVPRLSMAWSATLDFTTPVNPSFGPAETGIQRAHRPSQLSIGSVSAVTPLKSPSVTQPDALPGLEASATHTEAAVADLGITMSFTGPSEPIYPGDVFSWVVYVVNRSSDKTSTRPPRKLALIAVPKRRRNDVRPARPPSTASRRRGEKEIADAVLDENVLHAMQKNSAVDALDAVCLSADTRVGPLAPGACHVAEMQFVALREGVVGIEAIRVVDLASHEHVDIRDLPTTIVQPAAS